MKPIDVFKKTDEDWYGNFKIKDDHRYPDRFVRLSLSQLDNKEYRVSVWGNDDLGMELDFVDKSVARDLFSKLCLKDVINRRLLLSLGFNRC